MCRQLGLTYTESDCTVSIRLRDEKDVVINVIAVSPNPTKGHVQISGKQIISHIEVMGSNGKLIKKFQPNEFDVSLDLTSLENGLYLIRISTVDGKNSNKKLIIVK